MSVRDMDRFHRRRNPSFSSSLLDSIYRSIDGESSAQEGENFGAFYREKFAVKEEQGRERVNLRRAIMIESWMEKRKSSYGPVMYNSTSTSSDSSSAGGGFSSSEADSTYFHKKKSSRFDDSNKQRKQQKGEEGGGGFTKTKLRALKIYGELKKVKQPISPGGRISTFLNSIFSPGSAKKVKMCSVEAAMDDVSFTDGYTRKTKSACSSTTSFSRSCLSKTPSKKLSGNGGSAKRSVRFYPVSVIVDEDCKPCGQKCIYEDEEDDQTFVPKIIESSTVKKELVMRDSYQNRNANNELDFGRFGNYIEQEEEEEEDDDDDDDAESCSSSDLFELDHLMGIGRYIEELPVYETTNFQTNQAIANGLIL